MSQAEKDRSHNIESKRGLIDYLDDAQLNVQRIRTGLMLYGEEDRVLPNGEGRMAIVDFFLESMLKHCDEADQQITDAIEVARHLERVARSIARGGPAAPAGGEL